MNATDFITKEKYDELLNVIFNGGKAEYEKKIKTNGNTYSLSLNSDRYTLDEYGWIVGFEDENYKCDSLYDGRCIQGGTVIFYDAEIRCYDDFIAHYNRRLKGTPDYDEITQLSLF